VFDDDLDEAVRRAVLVHRLQRGEGTSRAPEGTGIVRVKVQEGTQVVDPKTGDVVPGGKTLDVDQGDGNVVGELRIWLREGWVRVVGEMPAAATWGDVGAAPYADKPPAEVGGVDAIGDPTGVHRARIEQFDDQTDRARARMGHDKGNAKERREA
jgi:hypothetical protein